MPAVKKAKFPCGICQKECSANCVGCGECDTWYHYSCENLDKDHIKELQVLPMEYVCVKCSTRWGTYLFQDSLQRLSLSASKSFVALKNAARMERVFLRCHTMYMADTITPAGLVQDELSNNFLKMSGGIKERRPFQTYADGNCLFNAASIATFGDQSKAAELRVLTCLEMI